jgi:hypothetical protein
MEVFNGWLVGGDITTQGEHGQAPFVYEIIVTNSSSRDKKDINERQRTGKTLVVFPIIDDSQYRSFFDFIVNQYQRTYESAPANKLHLYGRLQRIMH